MHELSIAHGILHNLAPWLSAQDENLRVVKIIIKAGPLRAVVPEALVSAWEIVRNEHIKTKNSLLEVDETYVKVACKDCGENWDAERAIFKCPKCNSQNLEIGGGNELFIESIETEMEG